jgi:hypothetical protein
VPSTNEVAYRKARPDDIRFVFDSWLRSWRKSPWAGVIPNNVYFPLTRSVIEQLIARGAEIEVACLAADPECILGWICHEQTGPNAVVHYLYVKDPYLGLGIDEALIDRIPGNKPGFYTFRYRQVAAACQGWTHAAEIARRK